MSEICTEAGVECAECPDDLPLNGVIARNEFGRRCHLTCAPRPGDKSLSAAERRIVLERRRTEDDVAVTQAPAEPRPFRSLLGSDSRPPFRELSDADAERVTALIERALRQT